MAAVPDQQTDRLTAVSIVGNSAAVDGRVNELASLLKQLESDSAAHLKRPPVFGADLDQQVIQGRLGVAAGLFTALQCRHPASAGHAFRVALTCSAWASQLELDEGQRQALEIAALLHDIGVIGIPDHVLLKPGPLDENESEIMRHARERSLDILRHSCASEDVLSIVRHVGAWFDGSQRHPIAQGLDIPQGARMIAIVEAFDAMTTDHVYRPASSHERAMTELHDGAGRQFDPELVERFAEFHAGDQAVLQEEVAERWLAGVDVAADHAIWQPLGRLFPEEYAAADALFQAKLLENMYDAVLFIDAAGRVTLWNRGAERLTGIASASIRGCHWHPELLQLADERGLPIVEGDCPVFSAIRSGVQSLRRLTICGRSGRAVAVDAHAIPVLDRTGITLGAILLFHDASSETSLEQRCQTLHDKATKDALTQLSNRAEFDRVHEMFVNAHRAQQLPCSLIICDLDRFKSVNDNYGHQAGDEVIRSFAAVLKSSCRSGDVVARYGGEEFVVLCADCDNATATRRAEQIRRAFAQVPQPKMDGKTLTASFGVTELQPGDTPETMLRRADRALLQAKTNGRNQVVQLGSGPAPAFEKDGTTWRRLFRGARPAKLIERSWVTPVPIRIAIEKLRGFIADHQARVIHIEDNEVSLEFDEKRPAGLRRLTDRPLTFHIDISFQEDLLRKEEKTDPTSAIKRTHMRVRIRPRSQRDRRTNGLVERARDVLTSLRSYLMATEVDTEPEATTLGKAKRMIMPWLRKH